MSSEKPRFNVIFRRYRRTRDGRVLDARQYGIKAWPIKIAPDPTKKRRK
jgi:hypothetical protein